MEPIYIGEYSVHLPPGLKLRNFPATGLMGYISTKPLLPEEEKTLPASLLIISLKPRLVSTKESIMRRLRAEYKYSLPDLENAERGGSGIQDNR